MAQGGPLLKCLDATAELGDYGETFLPLSGKLSQFQLLYTCSGQEGAVREGWAVPGEGGKVPKACSFLPCQDVAAASRR